MSEILKKFPEEFNEISRDLNDNDHILGAKAEDGNPVRIFINRFIAKVFATNTFTTLANLVNNKVDKIIGKGLSTNDYDDTAKDEVAKVITKVSYTPQVMTIDQELQARTNIKAAKADSIIINAFTDLNRVDLQDGIYNVDGSNSGILELASSYNSGTLNSVLQIYRSSGQYLRRRIQISTPQTYPDWSEFTGGALTGNEAVLESITRPTRSDVNFVFEGNSRSADIRAKTYGPSLCIRDAIVNQTMVDAGMQTWPSFLLQLPNFKNRGNYYNYGNFGQANDTSAYAKGILSVDKYNFDIKPHRPAANGGQAGIIDSFLFIMTGILDTVVATPSSIVTQINNYKAYVDRAVADGFKVIILGEFYGISPIYRPGDNNTGIVTPNPNSDLAEQARIKYNDAMMDYAQSGKAFMYIDVDHLFTPQYNEATKDIYHWETCYHLTPAGNRLIADYVNTLFNPVGMVNKLSHRPYVSLSDLFRKVDKVSGKQLSTYDYSSTDRNKLYSMDGSIAAMDSKIAGKLDKIPVFGQYLENLYVIYAGQSNEFGVDANKTAVLLSSATYIFDMPSDEWANVQDFLNNNPAYNPLSREILQALLDKGEFDFSKGDMPTFWGDGEDDGMGNKLAFTFDQSDESLIEFYSDPTNYHYYFPVIVKAYDRFDWSDRVTLPQVLGLVDSSIIAQIAPTAPAWINGVTVVGSVFTKTPHGLTTGEPIEFDPNTGVLPAGLFPYNYAVGNHLPFGYYYNVTVLTANTFEIYSDNARTIKVTPTNSGSGAWRLRKAYISEKRVCDNLDFIKHPCQEVILYDVGFCRQSTASAYLTPNLTDINGNRLNLSPGNGAVLSTYFVAVSNSKKYSNGTIHMKFTKISETKVILELNANLTTADVPGVDISITADGSETYTIFGIPSAINIEGYYHKNTMAGIILRR